MVAFLAFLGATSEEREYAKAPTFHLKGSGMYERSSPWDNPSHVGEQVLVKMRKHPHWNILGEIVERRVNRGYTEYKIKPRVQHIYHKHSGLVEKFPYHTDIEANQPAWVRDTSITFVAPIGFTSNS